MSEIVVADQNGAVTSGNPRRGGYTTTNTTQFPTSITYGGGGGGRQHAPEPFDSEKLPVTLKSEIQRFLRVANLIETQEPRVSCLCRFHAFVVAQDLNKDSSGRGVRQFKTSLLLRLKQDDKVTFRKRKEKSDVCEVNRVYRPYRNYIIKHGGDYTLETREMLINAREIASVLYEVLNTLTKAAGSQLPADRDSIEANSELNLPFNILPLEQGYLHHAIMQLPEVAQAFRPIIEGTALWKFTRVFAQAYNFGMGVVLFAPIASLAWLPIISAFQTHFLFNEAFSRRLQIQPVLKGKKKH